MNAPKESGLAPGEDPNKTQATDRGKDTAALHGDTSPTAQTGPSEAPSDWVGRKVGKYTITGVLGVGGMGVVLACRGRLVIRASQQLLICHDSLWRRLHSTNTLPCGTTPTREGDL